MAEDKPKSELFLKTIEVVKSIPKGKVLTYGKVAELADSPGSARYVSYILSSSSKKYKLPWYRVVGAGGKIGAHAGSLRQEKLLKKEGVAIERRAVLLNEHLWEPRTP